jgi:hypothetical protein
MRPFSTVAGSEAISSLLLARLPGHRSGAVPPLICIFGESAVKKPRKFRPRKLQYENLESREVMTAGLTTSFVGGVLTINGTAGGDEIRIRQNNGVISVVDVDNTWSASRVRSIIINPGAGDDFVSLNSFANGGNRALAEKVIVNSGTGIDRVYLANGHNVYTGAAGHKLAVSVKGSATLNGVALNHSNSLQVSLRSRVLTITSTDKMELIGLRRTSDRISIAGFSGSWAARSINSIVVRLQEGLKTVSLNSFANGGNQTLGVNVTVYAGQGGALGVLPDGNQMSIGGRGNVLAVTSGGQVTFNGQAVHFNPPAPTPDPPAPNPQNWFDANVQDAALRSLGHNLYTDGLIDRSDIIALLQSAQDDNVVDATELADLRLVASTSTLFGTSSHVQSLTNYVVNSSHANRNYQGQTLGNLAAGSSGTQLGNLINKWFLGLDRPSASGTYRQFAGSLFVNGSAYTDVRQGAVGDCYFVAALAEAALRDSSVITNMFVVNGDGTYTVKFFNSGQPYYVTVDSYLPTNSSGHLIYASRGSHYANSGNELWVALAEKAYAQLNEFGFSRAGFTVSGQNSYVAIEGGYIYAALGHVSGAATSPFTMTGSSSSFTTFVNAYNSGKMIGFASYQTPAAGSGVVGGHAYAVVGYNATAQTVTLFNPWGIEYGLLTMNWSQVQSNFMYFDRTA